MRIAPLVSLALLCAAVPAQRPARSAEEPAAPAKTPVPTAWTEQLEWRELGPANMGGRIIDIEVSPTDPSTWWVASASGGLLKTTNNGTTFEHQFDHEATVAVGAMAVAPSDPNVVWVGTGENNPRNSVSYGDGVYRSLDGGATWKNMGLRESFQIGDIVIDPRDAKVVYVGALGRLYGPSEQRGLYVTRDAGESWERVLFVDDLTGIIDIAMSPKDPDTMLVATYERQRDGFDGNDPAKKWGPGSGIWRTSDGGKTFERLGGGLPTGTYGRVGFDWNHEDRNVVFALVETEAIGKIGGAVGWSGLETSDAEAGAKITGVARRSPAEKAGLQVDDIVLSVDGVTVASNRRFREAMAKSKPEAALEFEVVREGEARMVAITLTEQPKPRTARGADAVESESPAEGEAVAAEASAPRGGRGAPDPEAEGRPHLISLGGQASNVHRLQGEDGFQSGGLFRSDDAGRTWRRINSINPRPMYFSQVRVDPSDDNWLFVLGVSMAKSGDAGETFSNDAGPGVHADQHAMWIDPKDGRHMMVGCDGGLYRTYDRGLHWDHLNTAALGQFYDVALDTRADYWVYGGLQDNGSWGAPHRSDRGSGTINEDWIRVGSGDGFNIEIDPNDPLQVYYESQNGSTGRTHLGTMESGSTRARPARGETYRYNWKTPFILSAHNSRIYYNAGNYVFRSLDRGNDLKKISPEITRTDRGSATTLAESPRNADVLYVGTDDGALYGTQDGGHTWDDLWPIPPGGNIAAAEASASTGAKDAATLLSALVPFPRWVSTVEASRFADGRAYVALDGHRSDDDEPYVLATEDFGKTWRSLRANLPRGSTRCLREDIQNENVLYLGTEFGFWVSIDRGLNWTRFGGEFPTVAVHDIAQHPTTGDIVLGTHGRSLWSFDATPIRQLSEATLNAAAHLFDPNDVIMWRTRHRRASSGARAFVGDNPSSEAGIFYHLKSDARSVALKIVGPDGKDFRILEPDATAGFHRISWDLRPTPQTPPQGASARGGRGGGGRGGFFRGRGAAPGTYRAILEVDGETFEQSFDLLPDPVLGASTSSRFGEDEDGADRDR